MPLLRLRQTLGDGSGSAGDMTPTLTGPTVPTTTSPTGGGSGSDNASSHVAAAVAGAIVCGLGFIALAIFALWARRRRRANRRREQERQDWQKQQQQQQQQGQGHLSARAGAAGPYAVGGGAGGSGGGWWNKGAVGRMAAMVRGKSNKTGNDSPGAAGSYPAYSPRAANMMPTFYLPTGAATTQNGHVTPTATAADTAATVTATGATDADDVTLLQLQQPQHLPPPPYSRRPDPQRERAIEMNSLKVATAGCTSPASSSPSPSSSSPSSPLPRPSVEEGILDAGSMAHEALPPAYISPSARR